MALSRKAHCGLSRLHVDDGQCVASSNRPINEKESMQAEFEKRPYLTFLVGVAILLTIALAASWEASKAGRAGKLLDNLSKPNSGEDEVLPEEVQFAIKYIRNNHIRSVRMSPDIYNYRFIAQPLTESLYPVIVTDSSNVLISSSHGVLPSNCNILAIEKGISIASCH